MKSFIWGLPEFFHTLIRAVTGYILVCSYDEETYEPVEFYWKKWTDYVAESGVRR
jgi:hypothetical protein